jgi:hypothetical protein
MSVLEILLRIAGASQIALAFAHLSFGRRFDWQNELARLSLLNRQIFHVHCFFICLVLVLMGLLGLCAPAALLERSRLGLLVAAGLTVFWGARLWMQWFVYDASLWRGKRFETAAHAAFSVMWMFYFGVYGAVAWEQWR